MKELQKEYKIEDLKSDTINIKDSQKIYDYITRICSTFLMTYEKNIEQFELKTLRLNSIFSNILLNSQMLLKEYEKREEYKVRKQYKDLLYNNIYKMYETIKKMSIKNNSEELKKIDVSIRKNIEEFEEIDNLKKINEIEIKKLKDEQYNIYKVINENEKGVINLIISVFKIIVENDILKETILFLIEEFNIDYEKYLFINKETFNKTINLRCFDVASYDFTIGKLTDLINICYELEIEEAYDIKKTKLYKYFSILEKVEKITKNKKYNNILKEISNIFICKFFETKIYVTNDNLEADAKNIIQSLETAQNDILLKMGWLKYE